MFQSSGVNNPYHYSDETINVMAYLGRFVNRWHYFLIGLITALLLAFIQIRTTTRIYKIGAKVILSGEGNNRETSGRDWDEGKVIGNFLTSEDLVKKTVKRLGNSVSYFRKSGFKTKPEYETKPFTISIDSSKPQLIGLDIYIDRINDQEFNITAQGNDIHIYDPLSNQLIDIIEEVNINQKIKQGKAFQDSLLSFTITFDNWKPADSKDKFFFHIQSLDQITAFFYENLEAEPLNDQANIILLTINGPLKELSKDFLNAHLETYKIQKNVESLANAENTIEAIDASILEILEEVKGKPIAGDSLSIEDLTDSIPYLSLRNLEIRRMEARRRMMYYQSIERLVEKKRKKIKFPDPEAAGMEDPVLIVLLVKYEHLLEARTDLAFKTGKRGPLWQMNQMSIKNTEVELHKHLSTVLTLQEKIMQEAENEIAGLMGKLGEDEESLGGKVKKLQENEDYYDLLEARESAITLLKNASSDVEIIENARLEGRNPIAPKKSLILLVAIFAGLGVPAGIIVFQDFLNQRMIQPFDIESGTNIPVMGFIGRHENDEKYIISKDSEFAEGFRSLFVKMNFLNPHHSMQVIGITSSGSGEGKTFCSANFATSLAQAGYRTLLMDIDLRRPRITRYFENKSGKGLANYLTDNSGAIFDLISPAEIENLFVLQAGLVKSNPLELLKSKKMEEVVEQLKEEFDYIIMDTPPVGLVSDYTLLMKSTDFNIYVVRESITRADSLNWINGLYDRKELTNVGLLINDVKSTNDTITT